MNRRSKIGLIMEVVSIAGLTVLVLKTECERHKTKMRLIEMEFINNCHEIDKKYYLSIIEKLEKELKKVKENESQ